MQDQKAESKIARYVMTVLEAGKKYFGIGRSASYEAARRREIPTIKIGRKLLVPVAAVERKLADA